MMVIASIDWRLSPGGQTGSLGSQIDVSQNNSNNKLMPNPIIIIPFYLF